MINFPTSLDTLTNPSASSDTVTISHAGQHSDANDAIEALEAKVGVNGSSVTTSLDYLVKNTSSVDPGHKHTVANLSDTTISSPTNGQALVYDTATSKWVNNTVGSADASTTVKGSSKLSTAPVSSSNPIAVGDNDTRVPTQSENDALQGTAGTPSNTNRYVTNDDTGTSGASKVLRLDGSGALPAVSGANLTSLPSALNAKNGVGTYTVTSGTTVQNIAHGLGVTPKYIKVTSMCPNIGGLGNATSNMSIGVYNGTTNSAVYYYNTSASPTQFTPSSANGNIVVNVLNTTAVNTATAVATFDSTNVTLTWTANYTGGTIYYMWEAIA